MQHKDAAKDAKAEAARISPVLPVRQGAAAVVCALVCDVVRGMYAGRLIFVAWRHIF